MKEKTKAGIPTPHEGQRKILELPGRFKVAVCGRRFGKTVAAAIAAVQRCEKVKDTRVWWISPVQEQSDRVEREVAFWLRDRLKGRRAPAVKEDDGADPADLVWQHRITEHALVHENMSRIEFHSAESGERLRGAGLDLVVIDEAADVSEYTWNVVLKPMLLERHGEAILTGTPRGKNHWLHRIYLLGQEGNAEGGAYSSIQLPTTANPEITPRELDDYRADMTPEMFQQEFEAQFIDGVGTPFTGLNACIGGSLLTQGRPGVKYVTGIDLGQSVDYTVLCSISCEDRKLEGFARFNQMDWSVQEKMILEHLERFPGAAIIDGTGVGKPIYEFIRDHYRGNVHCFVFSAPKRSEILAHLQLAFTSRSLLVAAQKDLLGELEAFTYVREVDGGVQRSKMTAPSGFHDDCVMALALAWYGARTPALWEKGPAGNSFVKEQGFFAGDEPPLGLGALC